ncbi:MAG: hypothetical protein ACE5JB_02585 [bacterium]
MSKFADTVLILGGAGLVGFQVARKIAKYLSPRKIVIASRYIYEAKKAVNLLKKDFLHVSYRAVGGDIFLREEFTKAKRSAVRERETERAEILQNQNWLDQIFKDIFGPLREDIPTNIRTQSLLVKLIEGEKPDVIVDCINTSSAISYQNVRWSSQVIKEFKDQLQTLLEVEFSNEFFKSIENLDRDSVQLLSQKFQSIRKLAKKQLFTGITNLKLLDILLISQPIPQIINHIRLLSESMKKANTRIYLKVGTTGTGGMGMNIPYTHGEDKPSFDLLSKTCVGFAHTGLLFLLARTPDAPVIKEIKPAAMIGYKKIEGQVVRQRRKGKIMPVPLYCCESETLKTGSVLELEQQESKYQKKKDKFSIIGVNTGENGFFGLGEFEAITSLGQMEFVTPEELADYVVLEIMGQGTGKNIITAIDSAVVDPSYRGGYLRDSAIKKIINYEKEMRVKISDALPSIATGTLGPPKLTKLLFEAYLIRENFPNLKAILEPEKGEVTPEEMSAKINNYLNDNPIKDLITSLGLPIIMPDGKKILRSPFIKIPETVHGRLTIHDLSKIDLWAEQGWVDLRPINFEAVYIDKLKRDGWIGRFKKMFASQKRFYKEGSSEHERTTYIYEDIRIGEVVAWIFSNEIGGYRAW